MPFTHSFFHAIDSFNSCIYYQVFTLLNNLILTYQFDDVAVHANYNVNITESETSYLILQFCSHYSN